MTNFAPRCHLCQPFFFGLIQSSSISSYAMDLKTSKFYSRNNRPIKHWLDMDKSGYSKNIQRQAKVFLRVLKIQPAKINGNIKSFWSEHPRNTMSAFGYCWVPWNTLIMGFTFWRYYDTKWLNFSPYRNSPIWATKVGATKCNYLTTLRAEQTDGNRVYCILSAQFDMKATMPGQAFDDVGVSRVLVGGCSLFDK